MDDLTKAILSILTAVTGVAILALILSNQSNTANILTSGGKAYQGILQTALSPVTGNTTNLLNGVS